MTEKRNKSHFGIDGAATKKFDWELSRKRIINDMKSDFIFAPHLRRVFDGAFDILKKEVAGELKNGLYSPSLPLTIDVPKSMRMRTVQVKRHGGPSFSRPGSILLPKDRLLYQLLADAAAPIIDKNTDKDRSYSHWIAKKDTDGKFFLPSRVCWGKMQEKLRLLSEKKEFKYVVKLDVANCFSSINQHTLINFLKEVGYPESLCNPLENLLVRFTGSRNSRGIIQGVFPSDLLGNFYLTPIDQVLGDLGLASVRYVDDIYVFVRTFDQAERVMRDISRALRGYDLYLNEYKSALVSKNSLATEEPDLELLFDEAIREVEEQFSDEDFASDYGFQADFESEPENADDGLDFNLIATQRLFRSASQYEGSEEKIERFCLPLFAKAESDFAVDHVIENLAYKPSMAQFYSIYIAKFLKDEFVRDYIKDVLIGDSLFYDWQKMWFLSALLAGGKENDQITKWCLDIVRDRQCHDALRAIAAIFVCRFGSFTRRKALSEEYQNIGSPYVQTALLYGTRYIPLIERKNAISSWSGHGSIHKMIADTLE